MEPSKEQLKAIKGYELELMDEIHRICNKYNINYSLFYGTLLGAIRHKGFIPWDDDIDIAMSETDYMIFKKACEIELNKDLYFLQDKKTDPEFGNPFYAKLRKNNTALVEFPNKDKIMHHGVWVDIFILKRFDGDLNKLRKKVKQAKIWRSKKSDFYSYKSKNFKGKIKCAMNFLRHPYTIQKSCKRLVKYVNKITLESGEYLFDPNSDDLVCFSLSDYNNTNMVPFEKHNYKCIKSFDQYLTKTYGNYMELPPVNKRISNHNFYKILL